MGGASAFSEGNSRVPFLPYLPSPWIGAVNQSPRSDRVTAVGEPSSAFICLSLQLPSPPHGIHTSPVLSPRAVPLWPLGKCILPQQEPLVSYVFSGLCLLCCFLYAFCLRKNPTVTEVQAILKLAIVHPRARMEALR